MALKLDGEGRRVGRGGEEGEGSDGGREEGGRVHLVAVEEKIKNVQRWKGRERKGE